MILVLLTLICITRPQWVKCVILPNITQGHSWNLHTRRLSTSKAIAILNTKHECWGSTDVRTISSILYLIGSFHNQIARFMGPTWGPPGSCRSHMGPILAPWTLLPVCVQSVIGTASTGPMAIWQKMTSPVLLMSKPEHVFSALHIMAHSTGDRTWNRILSTLSRDGMVQLGLKITELSSWIAVKKPCLKWET